MLTNCRKCGRVFQKALRNICVPCLHEEHDMVRIIRAYLEKNKLAIILDVVRDTEIKLDTILDLIDEGVLILVEFPNITVECGRCGNSTQAGRYCIKCRDEMVQELTNARQMISSSKDKKISKQMGYHSR